MNHIKTVQKWASEHPDIMEQYTAYAAYSGNQQDMCWLEKTGVPKGNISMQKVSSNPTMTEGNGCYSLEGAVYGVYDKDSNLITHSPVQVRDLLLVKIHNIHKTHRHE